MVIVFFSGLCRRPTPYRDGIISQPYIVAPNWLKVPLSANLDLMTAASVKFDLMMLLFIATGAVIPDCGAEQAGEKGLYYREIRIVACEKRASKLIERAICDVRFVKLLGEYGFEQ